MQDQEPPGLDELGPDGLSGVTMEVRGSDMGENDKGRGEIEIARRKQPVLRRDKVGKRLSRDTQEDSRDSSEHNSSGMESATKCDIVGDLPRYGIEEKSESWEAIGRTRVGGFANVDARKRGPPSKTGLDKVVPGPIKVGEHPAVGKAGEGDNENVEFTGEGLEVIGLHRNFTVAAVKEGKRPLPEPMLRVGESLVEGEVEMGRGGGSEEGGVRGSRCEYRVWGVREIVLREGGNIESMKGLKGKSS